VPPFPALCHNRAPTQTGPVRSPTPVLREAIMNDVRTETVTFTGADGASTLAARLDGPEGPPLAYALFAHCFTCGKNNRAAAGIARALAGRGIGVLRFDFTGLGDSEGEFANTDFSSNVGDLIAAATWLRRNRAAPALLIGHSLGGTAVLAAAEALPEVRAVCTIAAPADPAHVRRLLTGATAEIESRGEATVALGGRPFRIRKAFLDDIDGQAMERHIAQLRRPLLLFHGPRDDIVGIDNATRIFVAARHPKSFVSLDDADHLLGREEDAAFVAAMITAWAGRYVTEAAAATPVPMPSPPSPAPAIAGPTPPEAVRVTETGEGRFAQMVSFGDRHFVRADEPATFGGDDAGPSPYELLLAGLGACTTMTLRMYAELKKLPLERVSVVLRHDKIHAEDCRDCETKAGKIDRIRREITLTGALDDATRQRLLEIADRCPVHRTLHGEVLVETALAP
jgi:putative redox protein